MKLATAELPTLTLLKKFEAYCPFKTQWKLFKCDRIKHYEFHQRIAFTEFVFFSELTAIVCLKLIDKLKIIFKNEVLILSGKYHLSPPLPATTLPLMWAVC
jgi:hypothetical protein